MRILFCPSCLFLAVGLYWALEERRVVGLSFQIRVMLLIAAVPKGPQVIIWLQKLESLFCDIKIREVRFLFCVNYYRIATGDVTVINLWLHRKSCKLSLVDKST